MNRRTKRILAGTGFIVTLATMAIGVVPLVPLMAGLIAARFDDDQTAPLMRAATPILATLERFRVEHGCYPNAQDAAYARYVPATIKTVRSGTWIRFNTDGDIIGWMYERTANDCLAYSLSRKLGWDPNLIYRREGMTGKWVVDPGDGGDERVLATEP